MKRNHDCKEEYEVVGYPKLAHIYANVVQIISRNTHVHKAAEMGLTLEGSGIVRVNSNSFPIGKGSMFIFNANEPHQIITSSDEGVKIAYLQVARSFCGEYTSCFRDLELLENNLSACLSPAQLREITELMVRAMQMYLADDSETYGLKCICSICNLYDKVFRYVPYRQITKADCLAQNKKMTRLSRLIEYIDSRYNEKITLDELARAENVTKTYLSHFIHDNLNMTFQDYVSNMRFEHALKLIRNTTMCLSDISAVSGFSDVKYLSRMLEKRFGKPAQQCCIQLRSETENVAAVEVQTFVSNALARQWIADFWKNYQ